MRLRYRLVFLIIFLVLLILIGYSFSQGFSFIYEDFWFAAGLLLLILMSLIDQPFFSTDANVFMNGTAGLSLILVNPHDRNFWWYFFLFWCLWLVISSYVLMWSYTRKPGIKSPIRDLSTRINREIGKPEALFSAFFIWGALRQFGMDSKQIDSLFIFWAIFIVINIPAISRAINKFLDSIFHKQKTGGDIASLYRVSDPRVVEIKLTNDCPNQIVGRSMGLQTSEGEPVAESIVIDDRVVAGNRIAKIAIIDKTARWNYLAQQPEKMVFTFHETKNLEQNEDKPISVVDVGSTIEAIKFFIHPDFPLKKGEIVWTFDTNSIKVYYQITLANIIEKETVDRNFTRSVLVTANQLGVWTESNLRFEQFSWVPPVGQLIFKVVPHGKLQYSISSEKILIGYIPNSDFPVIADVNDIVTHNTAIIGITGSGKTYLSYYIIEALLSQKIKVLVLDLTREYFTFLQQYNPSPIPIANDVGKWFQSESLLGIHQFANSNNFPMTTRDFVNNAFGQLNTTQLKPGVVIPARLCIVFEEAHSLIPEWNQVADRQDPEYVNATARTILQGRKFGLGSLLVTQRTANVTKTILNQCNTMIAMRSFDQTGLDFLSNYMGSEYAQAISTLPTRDAIIVGKSSSCQSPVIFTIPDFATRWINSSNQP